MTPSKVAGSRSKTYLSTSTTPKRRNPSQPWGLNPSGLVLLIPLLLPSCMTSGEVQTMFEDYRRTVLATVKVDEEVEKEAALKVSQRIDEVHRTQLTWEEVLIAILGVYIPGAFAIWQGRNITRKRQIARAIGSEHANAT